MRRKERQRDESFAWDVLKKAPFVTVSMIGEDGAPYSVPVNAVVDDVYRVLYFHCAKSGRKLDALRANPAVSVCAVSRAAVIPGDFTTDYASAILRGRAEIVEDEGEREGNFAAGRGAGPEVYAAPEREHGQVSARDVHRENRPREPDGEGVHPAAG